MVHSRHPAHRALSRALAVPPGDLDRAGPLSYRRITAGLLWPVSGPPIPLGAVLVDARGRIAALGPDRDVPRPAEAASFDFADAAVLPGLVNVHTHLELTGLRGSIAQSDFVDWIQQVRRAKQQLGDDAYLAAARLGVQETWRNGITTVADTGTSGAVALALSELRGSGVAYHEFIAPDPAEAEAAFAAARQRTERLLSEVQGRVRIGVSPHAPYTVSRALYRRCADFARSLGLPLAGHVAESPAESAFVTEGRGPFADAWRRRGLVVDAVAASPVRLLADLGVLGPDFLAIHAVQTDAGDADVLAAAGCAVAVCPRSNARHGHGAPPLQRLLASGLRVGLGTDSVLSVDALDLLAEGREARWLANLSAEAVLRLLTLDAARALSLEGEIGSVAVDKWADLCVIRLPRPIPRDPALAAEAILIGRPSDIVATFVAGRPVYQAVAAAPGGE